jgi:hypothetical protein
LESEGDCDVDLSWASMSAPTGDTTSTAVVVTGNGIDQERVDNFGNSDDELPPNAVTRITPHGNTYYTTPAVGRSKWWKFVAPGNGTMHVEANQYVTNADAGYSEYAILAYKGANYAGLTDATTQNSEDAILSGYSGLATTILGDTFMDIDYTTGETVWICQVGTYDADYTYGVPEDCPQQSLDLSFSTETPPPNDDFANRENLGRNYHSLTTGSTSLATIEGSEPVTNPGAHSPPYPSVWYEWESPNDNNEPMDFLINVDAGTATGTWLEVFTGTAIGSLTLIDSDTGTGGAGNSQITLSTNGSINYKIRVSSPSGSQGTFDLEITAQPGGSSPANDDFANAELLTGYSDSAVGTTVGAISEPGEPEWVNVGDATNSVWYKYIPPQTGRMRYTLESDTTGGGTQLIVARGTALNNLVQVEGVELFSDNDYQPDFISVEGGVTYYFAVQGVGGFEDTFTISVDMANVSPPANDDPENATVISSLSGSINASTAGATWDNSGDFVGDFVTDPQEVISVWYKYVADRDGSVVLDYIDDTPFETTYTNDASVITYISHDGTFASAVESQSIFTPGLPETVAFTDGDTIFIAITSYGWVTATDVSYTTTLQEFNEAGGHGAGYTPSPAGNSTGDFDSVTGSFVADEDDGVFVASGTQGYGSVSPWTTNGTHHPYAWYCRFELNSTQGDWIYRYGQTKQWIEVFRATKDGGDYASVGVLGGATGTQTICIFESVSGTVKDTYVKAWGATNLSTSGKMVIEVGSHGVVVDGRFIDMDAYVSNPFTDTADDQFVDFDFGIITYPGDGTSYVDIDPEWNFRYSNIKIHDDLQQDVLGSPDTTIKEVSAIQGFTTGIDYPFNSADYDFYAFHQISSLNVAPVVASPGEYDGWALDCSSTGANINEIGWLITNAITSPDREVNDFVNGGGDSLFPGFSFRFWLPNFPSAKFTLAEILGANSMRLKVDEDGVLYIRPSTFSDDIPICTVNEETWNYVELQGDTSGRTYATKVWLQNFYLGRFESTYTPTTFSAGYPEIPPRLNQFKVGRIDSGSVTAEVLFRDLAVTRRKIDRPLGPTVIVPLTLDGVGEHNITEPDESPVNATDIAIDGNFTGGTDAAGQPLQWTGYDRFDTSVPAGAHKDMNLIPPEAFGDTLLTVVSETSGPPGFESDNALRIEIPTQNDINDDTPGAMYEFFPGTSAGQHIFYADTLGADFYIKGTAGRTIYIDCFSGHGAYPHGNKVKLMGNLTGGWDRVRLFIAPDTVTSDEFIHNMVVRFPGASVGDVYYIKDWKVYLNPEGDWARFWASPDGGTTVEEIHEDDTSSWEYMTDIPADTGGSNDVVYMNGHNFKSTLRGAQDDGKTHLPPLLDSSYLEYTWEDTDADSFFGLRLLVALTGWNDTVLDSGVTDFETFHTGRGQIVFSDADGNRRHAALMIGSKLFGVQVPHPAGSHGWTKGKWNNARVRLGMHEIFLDFGTEGISYGYENPGSGDGAPGVIRGIWAEALVYDRRLFPPNCARPIDLSRIRFRAYETPDVNPDEEET